MELRQKEIAQMKSLSFQQVDVFTAVPFKGNPVAVVLDGDTLSSEEMQSIAAWTNLSETTFVCTPTDQRADYRLRIFTPRRELPFAGHPTIGSARAVLRCDLKPRTRGRLVQECGRGLVDIKIDGERLLLSYPSHSFVKRPRQILLQWRTDSVSQRPMCPARRDHRRRARMVHSSTCLRR